VTDPLTVALCDDSGIFRQGMTMLLEGAGITVMASTGSGPELLAVLRRGLPDVVILDIRMPPTHTDEGIGVAAQLRHDHPGLGILVFSTYLEPEWVTRLLKEVSSGVGYLLKDRVTDARTLIDALHRVAAGSIVLEPQVVAAMLDSAHPTGPLSLLSDQERRVLALIAEGRSNEAIADRLAVSERTVESHVAAIFRCLDLPANPAVNRRVQAAITFLDANRR